MQISRSKLNQSELLEFFVIDVAARIADDLLEIKPNSATLFYQEDSPNYYVLP